MRKTRVPTPPTPASAAGHERQARSHRRIEDAKDQLARRADRRPRTAPMVGHRHRPQSSSGPEASRANSRCAMHLLRRRGRRGKEESVLPEPRHRAVVHDEAILAQHQPVAHPSDRQRRHGVGIDPVEERAASGPATSILPRVETSQTPTAARTTAPRGRSACRQSVSPACGKHCGAHPEPGLDEPRARAAAPACGGGQPRRAEARAARAGRRAPRSAPA